MKSLILICALALPQADCSLDTATAVVQGPTVAGVPAQCGLLAQAYIADTALTGYLDDGHYLKVICGSRPEAVPHAER